MSEPKEFDEIIHYERIGDSLLYNHYVVGELVRCKDCVCQRSCIHAQYLGDDGFCSRGERKDEVE